VRDSLRAAAQELAGEIVAWRRHLHRHPELSLEEHETARFVVERLRALDIDVHAGIAGTGVAGLLRAKAPQRPALLLRADMDALPVQEVGGREYGSSIAGRMHACGHDGHMAMLLGAAKLLAARRGDLPQDVVLCFQPAEEGPGGAERMIEAGVLDLVDTGSVWGMHLWSQYEVGTVHVRPGPTMAAQDEFVAHVVGRGGHGAQPHLATDPIVAAAHGVTALQSIVARSVDPLEAAVVTVGAFEAGSAANVIPDEARLRGTLRSFGEPTRSLLRDRVREVLAGTATAFGCGLAFEIKPGYPALINDPRAVEHVRTLAREVVGGEGVLEPRPMAAAEDFACFLERRPGAFVFLGAGNVARGIDAPHHSPRFDIDEAALPLGAELWARLALAPQPFGARG
jgi:amidohydrolase